MIYDHNIAVVYIPPGLDGFALSQDDQSGLVYEKEVIYVGDFVKKTGDDEHKFSVTEPVLDHWKNTWDQMLSNGLSVPWPVEHTDDPEKNRAKLLSSRIGVDSKGRKALFAKLKFNDISAAKLALSSDVSIYVAPSYTDGKGKTYFRPIRHVAFTDYPVIPELDGFKPIAASFVGGLSMAASPAMVSLAEKLGVPNAASLDDAQIEEAVVAAFTQMKEKVEGGGGGEPKPEGEPMPTGGQSTPQPTAPVQQQGGLGQGLKTTIVNQLLPPAMAASMAGLVSENRKHQIEDLVRGGNISRAMADQLIKDHTEPQALALSFKDDAVVAADNAAFAKIVAAAKLNKAIDYNEKTGAQGVKLSNPALASENPLVANAEARAAAAK